MKFELNDGSLIVKAETPREVMEMIGHYHLDTLANVDAIAAGELAHTVARGTRDNRAWFACSAVLGPEWVRPYFDKLEKITGFSGDTPTIKGPRYPGGYVVNLCHTHIVTRATLSRAGYRAEGFCSAGDWNGRTAAENAPRYFADYVAEAVGERKSEREFIEMSNGLLRRNPNYLKRHAPNPAATSALLFGAIWGYWLETHATAGQREIVERADACHRSVCRSDPFPAFMLRNYESGFRVEWAEPLIPFNQFREI